MFYFHGKKNEHFSMVSDVNLQINARFIGLRPAGRTRDYTWIQALGLMFGSHTFTVEAARTEKWDSQEDHLQFSYDGEALSIPEGLNSEWTSPENDLRVERISSKNSATVTLSEAVEISVNVIPVTEEDNRIHNYHIPSNNSFAHLEVQFRFFSLSATVEGVLGQTYQPNFHNPAKPGVAMPVVGGADKYGTGSLLSADCKSCLFSPGSNVTKGRLLSMEYDALDCTGGISSGNGIVCRK